ncbi:Transposon Ty3-G Gag-Pol polyprotein [Labeo rohita]|uniref:ribonuclease H n=1 Tax=Labeo rohita TaxID=84645 RepID=A0ABQ8LAB8_LABRO|nr:Transposon Ty3-G Gag-Pol polyprotein [Labeo rohita]
MFLPRLQNTAASDERKPWIFPPGLAAEPGRSSPPRGSLEQLVRQSPAGPSLQVSELAVQSTPEASLERLVPLVDYLAAWKLLPNVSAWVLRTVEKGYSTQFGAPPPPFDGVFSTVVGPEQALVMEQEVVTLLRKEAIEVVPPHVRESGFYSRYFIVPKKDGGLRPIIDLRHLNRSVMKLKFKMLTIKQVVSQIRSEDWFVTIDLKDAYFHVSILPQHRKFLRFAFRGEAYQYRVLPFGLALSPCTFTKCVDAALVPLRLQGIRILNYIDDWLILAASESLAVQHRDVVLAHMKALGLRLNAKKSVLSPTQRTTYLGVVWDSTTMQARLSPARIESILAAVKRVKEGRSLTVKQFLQLLGLMAAASNVIPFGLLYMRPLQWWLKTKGFSPRGNPLRMIKVTCRGLRALDMWRKPWFLNQGPVLGAPCRRVSLATDASLTGWGAVMSGRSARGLWSGRHLSWHINCLEMLAVFRALKYFLPDLKDRHVLVLLVLSSSSSSSGTGCYGTDVAEATSVRFSPDCSAPRSSGESTPGRSQSTVSSPALAGPSMVLGPDISPRRLSMGDSRQEGSPLTGGVVETILQSRAPSTRKLYALKWKLFTSWCGERQQDPANCPVGTVLEFLQARFSTGLAHSTLKVYVAAISAYHAPLGGMSVGRNPLVTRFLRGALRLRPPTRPHIPTWDLAVVLEALCRPPFEPIEEIPDRLLTIKTALLLALTSLKRVGDLQALSVAPSHLEFAPGMTKAFLYPRPELPCGVNRNNCSSAMAPLRRGVLLPSKLSVDGSLMPFLLLMSLRTFLHLWVLEPILLTPEPLLALLSLCPSNFTRQGLRSLVAWASRSPSIYGRSSSSRRGTSQVTYVTMVPRGNETLRLGPSFWHPCRALASFSEADAGRLRTCFYASWSVTSPARDILLSHWSDYTCSERGCAKGVPLAFTDAASRSLGEPWLHT